MPATIIPDPPETYEYTTGCGEENVLTDDEAANYRDCGCGQGVDCCGNRFCDDCHPEADDDGDLADDDGYRDILRYYSYTPDPLLFYGGTRGAPGVPFYGMEIEITCDSRDTMRWAKTAFNKGRDPEALVYLKADGSVHGFEAVTHPMTYPWALENFPWGVLSELKDQGCTIRPSDNGIHVHVSRTGFDSDAHTLRWFKLLYRNQEDVIRIARRSTTWARFSADHRRGQFAHLKAQKGQLSNTGIDRAITERERSYNREVREHQAQPQYEFLNNTQTWDFTAEQNRLYRQFDAEWRRMRDRYNIDLRELRRRRIEDTTARERYSAVNTANADTFEVRLFASTLDPATAQSTIGLVSAAVEYTRGLTSADIIKRDGLKWPKFSEWLQDQPLYAAVRHADKELEASTRPRSVM